MPELEDRLRESIRRHADQVELEGSVPEPMLRRAHRRMALTVGLACAIVVAAVGGGWALVVGMEPDRPRPGDPTASPSPTPTSEEEAMLAGVREFMDARMTANAPEFHADDLVTGEAERKYKEEHANGAFLYSPAPELEWDTWETLRVDDLGDRWEAQVDVTELYSGPLVIDRGNTRTFQETLTLRRFPESAQFLVIDVERQPPGDLGQRVWRLHDFLLARAAGRGAELYLADSTDAVYRFGGLDLYPNGESPASFGELVLSSLAGPEAVVRLTGGQIGDTPWCPHTEVLTVDAEGIVSQAERPAEGWRFGRLDGSAAGEFACAFLEARYAGDAERFLSAGAAGQYESGEHGLSLYEGICERWMASSDTHGRETPEGVRLSIRFCDRDPDGGFREGVLIAPGQDRDGNRQPALIVAMTDREELEPAI